MYIRYAKQGVCGGAEETRNRNRAEAFGVEHRSRRSIPCSYTISDRLVLNMVTAGVLQQLRDQGKAEGACRL